MILKTQLFQETCKTILMAVDSSTYAANLELVTDKDILYLNVTNREYYVSIKYQLEQEEVFHAVINAPLFLNLIATITTDEFTLDLKDNIVVVKAGKSNYKLPLIFENDTLLNLPKISLENITVTMPIKLEVLNSIVNVNSKELLKLKNIKTASINELQKLYYIDETGCFTFTEGGTFNAFTLEKPIKLLLNDRIIKLFRLFKTDITFEFGHDLATTSQMQTIAVFKSDNVYLAAYITSSDILLNKVQVPCTAMKKYITNTYDNIVTVDANTLLAALNRLLLFTKNSYTDTKLYAVYMKFTVTPTELIISDSMNNAESIVIENVISSGYEMSLNLMDFKLILEACKDEHITINCGDHQSVVIKHGLISHVLMEKIGN